MTEGNVAIVRKAYDAFERRDAETLEGLADADFVLHASPATDGRVHYGRKAFEEILSSIRVRWSDFRLEPLEFYEAGDRVLVLGTLVGKSRDDKQLASVAGQVWTLRRGKLASMRAFLSSEEAIREAGLTRLLT